MKQRKLSTLTILNIVTIGFYQIFWLMATRNEIVTKHKRTLPSAWLLLIIELVQIACVLLVAWIFLIAIPANQKDEPPIQSQECTIQQLDYNTAKRNGDVRTEISQSCQQTIDALDDFNERQDHIQRLLVLIPVAFVISGALLGKLLKGWYAPYAQAIEHITHGKMHGTSTMLLLTLVPFGFLAIQREFNDSNSL